MEEPLLCILKLLEPRGTGIEIMRKRGNLVPAPSHLVPDTDVEAAVGEGTQAIAEMYDGTNEVPRECCR
ncbi:hypothetical protein ABIA23_002778 [Sinorhizobium fredii]